jgi:hypothetical protein
MKWAIALFAVTMLAAVSARIGVSFWEAHRGHRDAAMRAIHYDTKYDLSAQRRIPPQ